MRRCYRRRSARRPSRAQCGERAGYARLRKRHHDDLPALIRETVIRSGDRLTTRKEVDFTGGAAEEWLVRTARRWSGWRRRGWALGRALAEKQNQGADGFQASMQSGAEAAAASKEAALKGMEEMAEKYREGGRELYVGQGDRERD